MKRIVESGAALCTSVERRCAPQWGAQHSTPHSPLSAPHQHGFTLIEMIMVIVITGIIGGMVAVFLKAPIQQYTDVGRRADMTDIADTALRRINRDLRLALPNSVRVTGGCDGVSACNLEFIPTRDGGRYRAGAGGTGDILSFDVPDSSFEVLGRMPVMSAAAGDQLVVYNLGIPCSDAYETAPVAPCTATNRTAFVSNPTATTVAMALKQFPFDSPGHRFHVVTTPVTYVCTPNAANPALGTLSRLSGYGWAPAAGAGDLLAKNVGSCQFTYDKNVTVVAQRSGLVTLQLTITEQGESVTLYSASHVSNQP